MFTSSIGAKEIRKCTDPKLLSEYACIMEQELRLEVAKNPYTPAKALNHLSYESNDEILLAVARHHNAGKTGLNYLGTKLGDQKIALAVAQNSRTSTKTLDRMYEMWNFCPKILRAIRTNPNVSPYTAELCTFSEME